MKSAVGSTRTALTLYKCRPPHDRDEREVGGFLDVPSLGLRR